MLKLVNLCVTVAKNSKLERAILKGLDLEVNSGEFVAVIGDNGAGKSTLFNAIAGYVPLDGGNIILESSDITNLPSGQRSRLIAKVLQDPRIATIENMTIEENMSFAYMRGQIRAWKLHNSFKRRKLFQEKLSLLNMGLEYRLDEVVSNLSGGQRQALSLIMATLVDSKVLLLDEITAALDPKMAELVMNLSYKIAKIENRTTLMITHNMEFAQQYGDRVMILENGKLTERI